MHGNVKDKVRRHSFLNTLSLFLLPPFKCSAVWFFNWIKFLFIYYFFLHNDIHFACIMIAKSSEIFEKRDLKYEAGNLAWRIPVKINVLKM